MAVQLSKAKAFLDRVLAQVPEAERETVRSLYSAAHDEASALERQLAEGITAVNTRAAEQADWWEKNKDRLVDPTKQPTSTNGSGTGTGTGNQNPITAAVDRAAIDKDVDQKIAARSDQLAAQGLFLSSVIPTIIGQHSVEFGEVLDGEKLVADAIAANQDIKTFYAASVAERRKKKADDKYAADIKAAEDRGRQAGVQEALKSQLPYPTSLQRGPTTLSGLRPSTPPKEGEPKGPPAIDTSLDAAVATAMEVMASGQRHGTNP